MPVERIPLQRAEALAQEVVELFRPYCERIEVAGSIRRRREEVKDIEICLIPKFAEIQDPSCLFGERTERVNLQFKFASELLTEGDIQDRLDANNRTCFGPRWQRVMYKGVGLDVFGCLDPEEWGVLFAVRTGPAHFSKQLVTRRAYGGFLLHRQFVKDWRLWNDTQIVETPTEQDLFSAIGMDFIRPEVRI